MIEWKLANAKRAVRKAVESDRTNDQSSINEPWKSEPPEEGVRIATEKAGERSQKSARSTKRRRDEEQPSDKVAPTSCQRTTSKLEK